MENMELKEIFTLISI